MKYVESGSSGVLESVLARTLNARQDVHWGARKRLAVLLGTKKVRSAYGIYLTPNWEDVTFRLCTTGAYGVALSSMLEQKKEPFIFIDIGANQGLYSLLAARNPYCRQVLALEPVSETFELLQQNITINKEGSCVTALRWALSDKRGVASIAGREGHSGVASLEERSGFSAEHEETVELHTFDELRSFLFDAKLPIFVKLDVEGHEEAVVRSLSEVPTIYKRVTDLFYEVDERWVSASDLEAQVRSLGLSHFKDIGGGRHRDIHATR